MLCSNSNVDNSTSLEVLYGQNPTPIETPTLVEESMTSFDKVLKQDKREDSNWRLAEQKCPRECRDEFKLIFLRCEVFQVELAVERYIRYWDNRVEVFGPDKAFRPILDLGPNGALKDNQKAVTFGYIRSATPGACEDPDGRAIIFIDGTKLDDARDDEEITVDGLIRATWYQAHVGVLAESTQRKGIVVLYRPVLTFKAMMKSPIKPVATSLRGTLPIRLAAVHILDPPALITIILTIAGSVMGKRLRERIHIHNFENHEKNLESLSKFGIGRKQLPKELGGDFVYETVNPETAN